MKSCKPMFFIAALAVTFGLSARADVRAWSPAHLGNDAFVLWLDAADAATVTTDNGSVTQWADKSGQDNHAAQPDGGMRPGYEPDELDGKPVVRFDLDDRLDIDSVLAGGTAGRTVFLVMSPAENDKPQPVLALNSTASGSEQARHFYVTPEIWVRVSGNRQFDEAAPTDAFSIIAAANPANAIVDDIYAFLNGYALTASDSVNGHVSLNVTGDDASVGGMIGYGGLPWAGDIAEILVFAAELSEDDHEKVEGYLAHKWGLEGNLPDGHQYKGAPPSAILWVNADFNESTPGWGDTSFASIQSAIDAANSGETIRVAAGEYVEVGQIVIDKNLTIIGEDKETTIIKPADNTGGDGDGRGWFLVPDWDTEFNLSKVTLDGEGKNIHQAIRSYGIGTIDDNIIKNMRYSNNIGFGIAVFGNMVISNNTIYNIDRVGISVFDMSLFLTGGTTAKATDVVVTGNTIIGKGPDADVMGYGIEQDCGAKSTITGNTFKNWGPDNTDWASAAIIVHDRFTVGVAAEATISGNTIEDNEYGIYVAFYGDDESVVVANDNIIQGNAIYGARAWADDGYDFSEPLDFTLNYWGAASGPYHSDNNPAGDGDAVSDNVIFDPWFDAASYPHWMVADFELTDIVLDPVPTTASQSFDAMVTVKNNGVLPGNAGILRVWTSRSTAANEGAADGSAAEQSVGALAVDESLTLTFSNLTAAAEAGTHHFRAFVDADGITREWSTGDNQMSLTYTIADDPDEPTGEHPDFAVTAMDFVGTPPTVTGAVFTVQVTVENRGQIEGDGGQMYAFSSLANQANTNDLALANATNTVGTLTAQGEGSVKTFDVYLSAPATPGTHHARAYVVSPETEWSTGDNQMSLTYTIADDPDEPTWERPDFAVTAMSFIGAAPTVDNEEFQVRVTVANHGQVGGDGGKLYLFASKAGWAVPGDEDDADADRTIDFLDADSDTTFDIQLVTPSVRGTHHVRAYVVSPETEWSTGDNQKAITYWINAVKLQIEFKVDKVVLTWNNYWGDTYTVYRKVGEGDFEPLATGTGIPSARPDTVNVFEDIFPPSPAFYKVGVDKQ